ncbi:GNAT family N-acetyltransferase [Herbiconiux sp. KACC 21604]|uniref:GNAT family N-acetyltransferase n=1 Tax=unclassified Herbiconiux TaxID=2618217 RepID=UPI0020A33BD6|nr:GNAT family N-acetyltransferase [Herbiconiux sp. SALV-R1]WPO86234.1 GNAT family N-acetyltransferase [Herbiconiux sp. KACC 21604]
MQTHGEVYAEQFGWGADFEALVARIVGTDAAAGTLFIAELDGARAGCVLLVRGDDDLTGKLRVLLVAPQARGVGVAGALVDELLRCAYSTGYRTVTLWTMDNLTAARRVYERAGFTLEHEAPTHLFGQKLVEQTWSLTLAGPPS